MPLMLTAATMWWSIVAARRKHLFDDDGLFRFDRHRLGDGCAARGNYPYFVGAGVEQERLRVVAELVHVAHEPVIHIHGGKMVGVFDPQLSERRLGRRQRDHGL